MPFPQDFNDVSIGTAAELAAAVAAGNFKAVRRGLEYGIRPDARDAAGNSALLLAVRGGDVPIAGILLGYGADVKDDKLLAAALAQESDNMVDLLLQSGADPLEHMNHSKRLMLRAAVRGVDSAVTALLMQGVDHLLTDDKGASLLILAAENGHPKVVDLMLKAGVYLHLCDSKGRSPLRAALQGKSLECVNLLLATGVDPGMSSEDKKVAITDYQFSRKCAPDIAAAVEAAYQKFLLINAAATGDAAKVEQLLKAGEPTDTHDRQDCTALTNACRGPHPKVVELLLKYKADPNLATKKMETPLDISVGKGDAASVKMLLAAGAVPSPVALHRACGGKHGDVVKLLLKHGLNPDVTARSTNYFPEPSDFSISNTLHVQPDDYPLHTAVKNGDRETVEALAAAEASTLVTNAENKTPLQLAQDAGNSAILKCVSDRRDAEMEKMGQSAVQLDQQIGAMKTLRFKTKGPG